MRILTLGPPLLRSSSSSLPEVKLVQAHPATSIPLFLSSWLGPPSKPPAALVAPCFSPLLLLADPVVPVLSSCSCLLLLSLPRDSW